MNEIQFLSNKQIVTLRKVCTWFGNTIPISWYDRGNLNRVRDIVMNEAYYPADIRLLNIFFKLYDEYSWIDNKTIHVMMRNKKHELLESKFKRIKTLL